MNPTDNPDFSDFDLARDELRDGIESSRQIIRQSRELIGLSECDGASSSDGEDGGVAN